MSQYNSPTERGCEDYWEILSAISDGEASESEVALLKDHRMTCQECEESYRFLTSTPALFRQIPKVAPPQSLRTNILDATIQRKSVLSQFIARYRMAGAVATAAAVIWALFVLIGGNPGHPREMASNRSTQITLKPNLPKVTPAPAPKVTDTFINEQAKAGEPRVRLAQARPGDNSKKLPKPIVKAPSLSTDIRPGFIGSSMLVASVPYDPSDAEMGYKTVQRKQKTEPIYVADESSGEANDAEAAKTDLAVSTGAKPPIVAAFLTADAKKRITFLIEGGPTRRRWFDQPSFRSSGGSSGLTLVSAKF